MKWGKLLRCLFWVTLCCILYLAHASDDDLMDFDFTDLKEIDWNYETDGSKEFVSKTTTEKNIITFDDDSDLMEENQVHPFDWREKVLRTALSKALLNKPVRQKFIEVMPILRVLSKQQRLALSALITAQINAKKGNELKLEQVRMMFGDDKSLILPIVFDIANLVRNSAKKYIEFDYKLPDFGDFSKTKVTFERRKLELSPEELAEEESNQDVGTLPAAAQLTQIIGLDGLEKFMSDEVLDPKEINEELEILKAEQRNNTGLDDVDLDMELEEEEEDEEEKEDIAYPLDINRGLQKDVPTFALLELNNTQADFETTTVQPDLKDNSTTSPFIPKVALRRTRRSARNPKEFVHKLVRSVSLSANEEDLERGRAGRKLKLNTTAFATPKETTTYGAPTPGSSSLSTTTTTSTKAPIIVTPEIVTEEPYEPYQLVEDLAFASLNGSEAFLDEDDNKENDVISETKIEPDDEILPTPEELISGPRNRMHGIKLTPLRSNFGPAKRKRVQVRARPKNVSPRNGVAPPKKCERFTASLCIKTDDYPIDHIMGSIRRHRNAMTALLAEYNDRLLNALDTTEDFDEYIFAKKRREDNEMQGDLCQSIVRYARPQKARSASGEWKYIVNTGQHTQTLRLEKCMNPQESCSYLASTYRSHCAQVYNYHRLLSWDKIRGLHVDIFKVPTCCSCQIDGFTQQYPALVLQPTKSFAAVYNSDQEDEEDDDFDFAIQRKHHNHDTSYDSNEVSSQRVKSSVPRPTVGSYLSPPVSEEYEEDFVYKAPRDTATFVVQQHGAPSSSSQLLSNHYLRELQSRRPNQFYKDSGSDQDFSPSEEHVKREVNEFGTALGKDESTHQNRKNIYSVTQTANTGSSGISDSSTAAISTSTGTIRAFTTPSTIRRRRPTLVDTNANKKPSITATTIPPTTKLSSLPSSAAATTRATTTLSTTTKRAATLQTYYYNRSRHVLKNQSRLPHTIASTSAGGGGRQANNAASTTEFEHEIPTTTATTSASQQQDFHAVNQNNLRNHSKTKFSLTYTTTPTLSNSSSYPSPPKRINYSYHPIIDFFEYSKRITTTTTTTTTPHPLVPSTENTSYSSDHLPSFHLYPHKIHKPVAVFNYQQQSSQVHSYTPLTQQYNQQPKQQLKYRPRQTESRNGYGAAAAVAAATDGDGIISYSKSGVVSNIPRHNTNPKINYGKSLYSSLVTPISSVAQYKPSLESNIWHPMAVDDF